VECWIPARPTLPAPPPATTDPVYPWLATQPDELHLVELPVDFYLTSSLYQYASTAHWRRMVDGNMGLLPPVYPYIVQQVAQFPDAGVVSTLRALGVTHAVVHPRWLSPSAREHLAALRADPASRISIAYEGARSLVLDLRRAPAGEPVTLRGRPLARDGWRADASPADDRAGRAIDADPATAWSSWGDLEAALGRWYDPVPFAERWHRFLSQPARLEVDLGRTVPVTGLVVRLGGSDPLAAPELLLETSLDGHTWERRPGGLAPWPDVRALVTEAAAARFVAAFAEPVEARAVRLSSSGYEVRIGDLAVYAQ
jgi:hypothetical protein